MSPERTRTAHSASSTSNFLPFLSRELPLSEIPELSRLPWAQQTLREGIIPGVKHLRVRDPTWAQCITFLTEVPSG